MITLFDFSISWQQGIEYCLTLSLLAAIFLLGCRRPQTMIKLFALQSLGLVLLNGINGYFNDGSTFLMVSILTFVGKCLIIPLALLQVIKKVQLNQPVESHLTFPTSLLMGAGLVVLAYYLTHGLPLHRDPIYLDLLSAGVSLLLIGLFVMMTHKNALTQIIGLYVLDNGIFCFAAATGFEMPLIVEMGILLELLLSVLVLGVWIFRIKQSFDTVNVESLRRLRG